MSQMVEQMARLIANRLASGGAIYLPERGSLFVAFYGARRISKREIRPPYRKVEFSSQERGESLPEIISRAAACDAVTARTIYDRWLAQTCKEEQIEILGVGKLANNHFTMTAEFDKRLNPQGHVPVRVRRKRRFDWVLLIGIVAILVAGAALFYYLTLKQETPVQQRTESPRTPDASADAAALPEEPVSQTETAAAAAEPAAPASAEAPIQAAAQPEKPAQPAQTAGPADYSRLASGHWYVVMGVFSTQENAENARKHFAGLQSSWNYTIHPFGSRFMLACYVSTSEESARNFQRQNREQFPDLWVHAAR